MEFMNIFSEFHSLESISITNIQLHFSQKKNRKKQMKIIEHTENKMKYEVSKTNICINKIHLSNDNTTSLKLDKS